MIELARAYLGRYLAVLQTRRRITDASAFTVSEDEAELASMPSKFAIDDEEFPREDERIGELAAQLDAPGTRLERLVRTCGLEPIDVRIIALLLAPELDPELERGYSFALDDFTKKRPDLRFIARMIGGTSDDENDRALTRFDEAAPLRRFGIVTISPGDVPAQLRQVRLADRIVSFFRGH